MDPPNNGYIIGNSWANISLTFNCKSGYWLLGDRNSTCDPNTGKWTDMNGKYITENPQCKPTKLGTILNPASSCKAVLDDDWSSPSGVYHIITESTVTKVYCYMEDIPGCGGGGWTTVMKTIGHSSTFGFHSSYWTNKKSYHVTGGQSGVDHQETKLPTYWTAPFSSLCLGMVASFQRSPNWIRVTYRASSLCSVIADSHYRSFYVGRDRWKSLIPGSSLQRNCNQEGFKPASRPHDGVRIGIVSDNENDCKTPDSRIGYGGVGLSCGNREQDNLVYTGNRARCDSDNGDKLIKTYGFILVQ